jgi:ribonuclease BN (tRNA processing enzyme)
MAEAFDFRTASAGEVFELGPFRITPFEMQHIGVLTLGYRIEAGGVVLAYTGDTGPCEEAISLGRDADLFLCEATYQNDSTLYPFHLSAAQAGEVASTAGADHLVLTHLTPELDHRISIREAAETFDGPIDIAVPGMVLEVGR